MSMIEKAAAKLAAQKQSRKKSSQSVPLDSSKETVDNLASDDKKIPLAIPNEASQEIKALDFDISDSNESETNKVLSSDDMTIADITDISGYDGFSIKSKRSTFSNNLQIDLNKLNDDGFITPKHPDSELSSSYRMCKRPILQNAFNKGASIVKHPNLIMVTSSLANEGKTYSAVNLAISIAMEQDLNVLLIDADIRKPSLAKTFNVKMEKGLTDVLLGDVNELKDVLYNTNIPSLTLMGSGTSHPNGTELLSSDSMSKFAAEIAERYPNRIIIFDSPPLLQTTESSVLASHMGQVILVVEAEKTLSSFVDKSISLLQNEIVLLLLNKQRERKNDIKYGYGYGY